MAWHPGQWTPTMFIGPYALGNGMAPWGNGTAPRGNGTAPRGNGIAPGGNGTAPRGNGTAPRATDPTPGAMDPYDFHRESTMPFIGKSMIFIGGHAEGGSVTEFRTTEFVLAFYEHLWFSKKI